MAPPQERGGTAATPGGSAIAAAGALSLGPLKTHQLKMPRPAAAAHAIAPGKGVTAGAAAQRVEPKPAVESSIHPGTRAAAAARAVVKQVSAAPAVKAADAGVTSRACHDIVRAAPGGAHCNTAAPDTAPGGEAVPTAPPAVAGPKAAPRRCTKAPDLDTAAIVAKVLSNPSAPALTRMTVPELKCFLKEKNVFVYGKKEELVQRILQYMSMINNSRKASSR